MTKTKKKKAHARKRKRIPAGAVAKIADDLRPLARPIAELIPDPDNVRLHDERNLSAIAESLERFGQVRAAVVQKSTGRLVIGNGMLAAAKHLGWSHLAVIERDLNDVEARALAIADNRSSDLSEFDLQALGAQLEDLRGVEDLVAALGYTEGEMDLLANADWSRPDPKDAPLEGHQRSKSKDDGPPQRGSTVYMTEEQFGVVADAVDQLRDQERDPLITMGRALELICADWSS